MSFSWSLDVEKLILLNFGLDLRMELDLLQRDRLRRTHRCYVLASGRDVIASLCDVVIVVAVVDICDAVPKILDLVRVVNETVESVAGRGSTSRR